MNIYGHIFSFLTDFWLLIGLIIIAIVTLCFPDRIIEFKAKYPGIFWFILGLAVCIQFPLLFGGCWGLGMKYVENRPMSQVVDMTFTLLPVIYIGLFFVSLGIQGRKKQATLSSPVAALSSLVLSPFVGFLVIELLGTILK